jgi:Holliday junction DNA helicase RuvB
VIEKAGDLAGLLTNLEPNDVLFIDEIHRLSTTVEEYLYSAMEDYRIDILIDTGPSARTIQINLNPFTLIGATTQKRIIDSTSLLSRFAIKNRLDYYTAEVLQKIVQRSSGILGTKITSDAAFEIARRSRGTPRIAIRPVAPDERFRPILGNGIIDLGITQHGLPGTSCG